MDKLSVHGVVVVVVVVVVGNGESTPFFDMPGYPLGFLGRRRGKCEFRADFSAKWRQPKLTRFVSTLADCPNNNTNNNRATRAWLERAGINAGRTQKTKRGQHVWFERFSINAGFTDPHAWAHA